MGINESHILPPCRPLGPLTYLRLWHDNTGRGHYASWHCTAVIVRDVQTNERFEFILNRWLGAERDDGQVSSWVFGLWIV